MKLLKISDIGPDNNNNRQWNIAYKPTKPQNFQCEKCGLTLTITQALTRHIRLQHTTVNLICPSCDYQTTHNDNIRRHLRTVHKLQKVSTLMDNLQQVKKSEKTPMMAKTPAKQVKKNTIQTSIEYTYQQQLHLLGDPS